MKIINTEQAPVKMWLDDIEPGAMAQVKNLANFPFTFHHVAIMPDSHQGYGMPIGGVLATRQVIIPNAVGVDIGCGMCAVKTSLTSLETSTLKKIMGEIRKAIPVGFEHHKEEQSTSLMPDGSMMFYENKIGDTTTVDKVATKICFQEYNKSLKSIGTLGGGNHFIEIQKGSDGHIWIMIHSGSRNLGKQVADYYNKIAIKENEKWASSVPREWELAFLPIDSEEGRAYIREMNYCVEFALANRKLMMEKIGDIFMKYFPNNSRYELMGMPEELINIAHNYAKMENHFGENVMVHRKGATLATTDTVGIIPGSQGTKSYIVKGKGNADSFNSCSHGAGRKMGRNQAEKNLNLEEEIKKLDDLGVIHAIRGTKDLDEAPGAYKDIDEVMKNQEDLVEILVELTPLGVIKG
ncbi:RtcB family protein [bacterium]|nr:RtcB family protein [bacterium]